MGNYNNRIAFGCKQSTRRKLLASSIDHIASVTKLDHSNIDKGKIADPQGRTNNHYKDVDYSVTQILNWGGQDESFT